MDGPVIGAIITASVALVVSVGGAVRGVLQAAVDRRYERRRMFLMDAQDAMLLLREALAAYGAALQDDVTPTATMAAEHALTLPAEVSGGSPTFLLSVPRSIDLQVATAQGRLTVARSRLDDAVISAALGQWEATARVSLIDPQDLQAVSEQDAFEQVNELIGAALRSLRVRTRRAGRAGRTLH